MEIQGNEWLINGRPTYEGVSFRGMKMQGLLMNSRMVQGIFDDLNPETRSMFDYPDGAWDAGQNTREFCEAMAIWREHGLAGFTINLQGGSPQGYSRNQPWHNSAFAEDGSLRPAFMERLEKVLDRADELGMVVILGYFYFGQDERLRDEEAVKEGCRQATDWLLEGGWTNVVVEIANEVDLDGIWKDKPVVYEHEIIRMDRCWELVELVRERSKGKLLVSTSTRGDGIPSDRLVESVDFVLLHGNSVEDPARIRQMVEIVRAKPTYRGQPIVFNEDDHFDFDQPDNNMVAAVDSYAGWGYL